MLAFQYFRGQILHLSFVDVDIVIDTPIENGSHLCQTIKIYGHARHIHISVEIYNLGQ